MTNYPVFDGHCDTAVELWRKGELLAENSGQVSLAQAADFPAYVQFFAFCTVWIEDDRTNEERFEAAMACFSEQLRKNRVPLCRSAADVSAILRDGGVGALLSIEGAEAIGCDPGRLEKLAARGVRMIAPVWNYENALCGSCVTGSGLSAQGREFVRRAQRAGIILDVSHMSERGFWEVCELAEKPIVASHSNAKAVCGHVRNLMDAQFRALCDLGGTAGLNLYAAFLNESGHASMDDVRRHLEHFLALGGEGHLALGGDLDGCEVLPDGMHGLRDYALLENCLKNWGFDDRTIKNLFYKSLEKVVNVCIM